MTTVTAEDKAVSASRSVVLRKRSRSQASSLLARGEPMVWLTGGALWICIIMIVGLLGLVLYQGVGTFWPTSVVLIETHDGRLIQGEVTRAENYELTREAYTALHPAIRGKFKPEFAEAVDRKSVSVRRRLVRIGNYELTNEHFVWVSDFEVAAESQPEWAVILERRTWGRFYGRPISFHSNGKAVENTPEGSWTRFRARHQEVTDRRGKRQSLEQDDMGRVNHRREEARLAVREAELDYGADSKEYRTAVAEFEETDKWAKSEFERIGKEIGKLNELNARHHMVMKTADGQDKTVALEDIVRAYRANQLDFGAKAAVYGSRWWEFLTDVPREANSEGGVFPAIFGTAMLTMLMSVAVVPFGVLAALYLREYAKAGPIISIVRIAINNLAGVPSIVFGVFGLGFFCYGVGSFLDGGPSSAWSKGDWLMGLAVFGGLVFLAVCLGFLLPRNTLSRSTGKKLLGWIVTVLWVSAVGAVVLLVMKSPYFQGFYRANLPNPTFGKGAMIWASMTLALLTLPVVIVATEEALAAVPNSVREGSYACGGSKWQTIRRIVLPRAMPGIMTGAILAMARGAGEVAPLMLVGAVKLAPELPIAASWPFGTDRSFMHLGFHIYDLGFQSQNSEAAKPMVYTTTLLLILMIAVMNLTAVWLRGKLRKRFVSNQF